MKNAIKKIIAREKFRPRLIGIFINPYYFTRRGLYKAVFNNKSYLTGRMLDFGCGNKPYKDLIKVDEYIGLDIEESGHDSTNYDVDVYWDGKTIPFENNYFDSILSSEVLEHVFEPDNILQELNRVCKKGGKLVLTVPFVWNEHEVPYDFGRYSSYGIKHLLKKHGFEILDYKKTTNYVETVFQLWNTYVFQSILRVPFIQALLTPILIAPVTLVGLVVSKLLPKDHTLFLNNAVVAIKK